MPEQLLDDAQVGATLEKVRRERMTQRVRADPVSEAGRPSGPNQHLPGPTPVQAPTAHRHEEGATVPALAVPARQPARPDFGRVSAQPGDGNLPNGYLPLSIAFADNADESGLEIDVIPVQADGFRYAQAGGVQEFEQGPVSDPCRRFAASCSQQPVHLIDGQHLRKEPGLPWQVEAARQVRIDQTLRVAEAVEAAQ